MTDRKQDKYPEKLSERLEIRLHRSAKHRFLDACKRAGDTPSDILRTAMADYVAEVERAEQKTITRELSMAVIRNPLKTLTTAGLTLAAALAFTATPSFADRDAQPIEHPTWITYPIDMANQGITAECKAHFDVSADGFPRKITVECTHPGFVDTVERATARLRFRPKHVDGKPVKRRDVVYPYSFTLDEPEETSPLNDQPSSR